MMRTGVRRALMLASCAMMIGCAGEPGGDASTPGDGVPVDTAAPPAGDTAGAETGGATGEPALRADGIGDIAVGISLADAMDRAGSAAVDPEPAAECRYVTFPTLPAGVSFMVVRDTIRRVDVDSAGVLSERGAGIGMTTARVEELHGASIERMPHKYEPDGEYLIIAGSVGDTRLVFETAADTVRTMRGGVMPEVLFVERCG